MSYILSLKTQIQEDFDSYCDHIKHFCHHEQLDFQSFENKARIEVCIDGYIEIEYEQPYIYFCAKPLYIGAGFHAYVCQLYKKLQTNSKYEYEVYDPTNYYTKQDFVALKKDIFEKSIAITKEMIKDKKEEISIFFHKEYTPIHKPGFLITNFGYLPIKQFEAMSNEECMKYFFYWNELGKHANYYLSMANYLLWRECYFEYSGMNEMTLKWSELIINYLEIAHQMDPSLAIPYETYLELCNVLQEEAILKDVNILHTTQLGYRKQKLNFYFGLWTLLLDGCVEVHYDENKNLYHVIAPFHPEEGVWNWMYFISDKKESLTLEVFNQEIDTIVYKNVSCQVEAKIYEVDDYYEVIVYAYANKHSLYMRIICLQKQDIDTIKKQLQTLQIMKEENTAKA